MSALKLVLDVGVQFIPGAGKILDAGLGMLLILNHYLSFYITCYLAATLK